jgi:hypothetical protein
MSKINVWIIKEFSSKKFHSAKSGFWYHQVGPSQAIGIWWHEFFQHLKTNFSYKCYMDGHRMNIYMLSIYIIHGPFGDIMLNHNLWLDVGCDFIDGIKAILVVNVDCNYFIVTKL